MGDVCRMGHDATGSRNLSKAHPSIACTGKQGKTQTVAKAMDQHASHEVILGRKARVEEQQIRCGGRERHEFARDGSCMTIQTFAKLHETTDTQDTKWRGGSQRRLEHPCLVAHV